MRDALRRACYRYHGSTPCTFLKLKCSDGSYGHVCVKIDPSLVTERGSRSCMSISTAWSDGSGKRWCTSHWKDEQGQYRQLLCQAFSRAFRRQVGIRSSSEALQTASETLREAVRRVARNTAAQAFGGMTVTEKKGVRDFYFHGDAH